MGGSVEKPNRLQGAESGDIWNPVQLQGKWYYILDGYCLVHTKLEVARLEKGRIREIPWE